MSNFLSTNIPKPIIKLVLILVTTLTQMQELALGLIELHKVNTEC